MFNAIFGNFLFSSSNRGTTTVAETVPDDKSSNEASTQTTSISTATQTSLEFDVQIGVGSNDDNNVITDTKTSSTTTGTTNPLDWVIIDPSEGNMSVDNVMDESLINNHGDNLVEMGCQNEHECQQDVKPTFEEDNDVLLGSFFDKNEHEDNDGRITMSNLFRSGLGLNENYDQIDENNEDDNDETNAEEQAKETVQVPAKKDETWLITPLPCLTSITESSHQRSMIDNYPLENLLIEHPSMSVFISATNASTQNSSLPVATCSPRQQKLSQSVSLPLINVSNQIEVTQLDDICYDMTTKAEESTDVVIINSKTMKKKNKKANKKNNRKPNRKVPRRSVTFDKIEPVTAELDLEPIIFTIGDHENDEINFQEEQTVEEQVIVEEQQEIVSEVVELGSTVEIVEATVMQQVAIVEQQIDSANSSISKKCKKSKKSKSSLTQTAKSGVKTGSNNKENMQVKTLLLNEIKKCGSHQNGSAINHNRFELCLLNKNQMRRCNKNSTFSSVRNVNSQQRKYHKLQQPSFSINIQQF